MKFWYAFFAATGLFASQTSDTLYGLQQIRDLMPERLWVQEFSILVDRSALKASVKKNLERKGRLMRSCCSLSYTEEFLLRSTMSGANIRMLDRYQEFEQSPFWRYPEAMDRLYQLEGR